MTKSNRLYNDLAWTFPIISKKEDYIEEGEFYTAKIREHSRIKTNTLLNLGSGAGNLDWAMKMNFDITGVDLSPDMVRISQKANPEIAYHVGDMRMVRLDKQFDAVIIHDVINYMLTPDDLKAAFITAHAHLKPKGLLITTAEEWTGHLKQNRVRHQVETKDNIEIVFIENYYDPDPNDTTYEGTFIYLIRQNGVLQIETDHHVAGIFPLPLWSDLMKEVGFEVIEDRFTHSEFAEGEDYPMFIGIKR